MVCVAVFFLSSCYQFEERVNGLEIYSSQFHGDAFAAYYYWDLNSEQMDIVIPDTYRNYLVRHIGGYFGRGVPAGFTVVWDVSEADSYDHNFTAVNKSYTIVQTILTKQPSTKMQKSNIMTLSCISERILTTKIFIQT